MKRKKEIYDVSSILTEERRYSHAGTSLSTILVCFHNFFAGEMNTAERVLAEGELKPCKRKGGM